MPPPINTPFVPVIVPTVITASLTTILNLIGTQLVTDTGFPSERVNLVRDWPTVTDMPVGDQDLYVSPREFVIEERDGVNGAGRLETIEHRRIGILIRTRLGTDAYQENTQWFNDATKGHIQLEEVIKNSLHGLTLIDSSNNIVVTEQLKLRGGDPYENAQDPEYGGQILYFDLAYLPPLDRTRL
jgi:hypothetical protein